MTPSDRFIAQACDPRLAPLAFAATPAWLWKGDGARVLWCNAAAMAQTSEAAGREIAALFPRLPMDGNPQLARLRSLAPTQLAPPLTCVCRRMRGADGEMAVLVTATEAPRQTLPLGERIRRALTGGKDVAAFDAAGELVFASDEIGSALTGRTSLASLGVSRANPPTGEIAAPVRTAIGDVQLYAFGEGEAAVTVARLLAPAPAPPFERPAMIDSRVGDDASPADAPPKPTSPQDASPSPEAEPEHTGIDVAGIEAVAERLVTRRHPLRFVWRMEADGAFTVQEGEFTVLAGEPTAAMQARPWQEVSAALKIDPQGAIARAIAARETWSGAQVEWPVEGSDETLPVSLSGLPALDATRAFLGYRGFGVCRDMSRIAAVIALRRARSGRGEHTSGSPAVAGTRAPEPLEDPRPADVFAFASPREARTTLTLVPLAKNVVPLRAGMTSDLRPGLSPVEQTAFQEIARALGARLESDSARVIHAAPALPPDTDQRPAPDRDQPAATAVPERAILDRLPHAIVAFRADRILFANRALLDWTAMESVEAIVAAGGLDALFIDPSGPQAVDAEGSPRTLLLRRAHGPAIPVEAQLFTLGIAGAPAAMLLLTRPDENAPPMRLRRRTDAPGPEIEGLHGVLDLVSDAIVTVDQGGHVAFANARAASLFGYERPAFLHMPFVELFATESRDAVTECLDQLTRRGDAQPRPDAREVTGHARDGQAVPLSMTLDRMAGDLTQVCAVLHDLTPTRQADEEMRRARRQAEDAAAGASDLLATIVHEIKTRLNAIVGFAEIMAEERLGPMGNDRYHGYARDIHNSARQMLSVLDDMLDLSSIEAGRLDLSFARVDLNDVMQQCIETMQPQAHRERVIIRAALAPAPPRVLADAHSVRQMLLNLLSNSIKFTGAGGQIILSTAMTDAGEAVLRVRDTGIGMSEDEIAAALKPVRKPPASERPSVIGEGLGLSLTKALAEANRARFRIKSAINAGTLAEIVFPAERVVVT